MMDQLKSVVHDGCKIAYWTRGRGPAILLIQGVGVQGAGWHPQIDALASQFTCIWFDNRGLGLSKPVDKQFSVEQMASDAHAVLLDSGYRQAHIVGHSLGGLVAVQLALDHRASVESLSLLCTFSGGKYVAPLTARMIWLGMRTQIGTRRMRRLGFLRLVSPPGPISDPDAMADRVGKLFGHDLADQPSIVRRQLRAMKSCDITSRLKELAGLPTTVVSATHDPIAPPSSGRVLSNGIPNARYVEFKDASHGLPITHALEINQLLIESLQPN